MVHPRNKRMYVPIVVQYTVPVESVLRLRRRRPQIHIIQIRQVCNTVQFRHTYGWYILCRIVSYRIISFELNEIIIRRRRRRCVVSDKLVPSTDEKKRTIPSKWNDVEETIFCYHESVFFYFRGKAHLSSGWTDRTGYYRSMREKSVVRSRNDVALSSSRWLVREMLPFCLIFRVSDQSSSWSAYCTLFLRSVF